jgi:hypothetical protein
LERKDPVVKAERRLNKTVDSPVTGQVDPKKPIPAHIKHQVMRRDGGRCTHQSQGFKESSGNAPGMMKFLGPICQFND